MKITKSTVLLRLGFNRAGNDRKASLESVHTEADKKRLKLTKKLFTCNEYKKVQSFDNALTSWVETRAIAAGFRGIKGIKLLPLDLLVEVENRLSNAVNDREMLVTRFMQVYDSEREKARADMKEFFDPKHYPLPGKIAERFGMFWDYLTFEVPENLPAGLMQQQQEKLEARFAEMGDTVRDALRETLQKLLSSLVEQLVPKEDGKKRRFYDSSIENLAEFLHLFSIRNVTEDAELETLAQKAEQVIAGASGEKIRTDAQLRESMKVRTEEVLGLVKNLIATEPRRKFKLNDEDEF